MHLKNSWKQHPETVTQADIAHGCFAWTMTTKACLAFATAHSDKGSQMRWVVRTQEHGFPFIKSSFQPVGLATLSKENSTFLLIISTNFWKKTSGSLQKTGPQELLDIDADIETCKVVKRCSTENVKFLKSQILSRIYKGNLKLERLQRCLSGLQIYRSSKKRSGPTSW